jgi:hypothetical protein
MQSKNFLFLPAIISKDSVAVHFLLKFQIPFLTGASTLFAILAPGLRVFSSALMLVTSVISLVVDGTIIDVDIDLLVGATGNKRPNDCAFGTHYLRKLKERQVERENGFFFQFCKPSIIQQSKIRMQE